MKFFLCSYKTLFPNRAGGVTVDYQETQWDSVLAGGGSPTTRLIKKQKETVLAFGFNWTVCIPRPAMAVMTRRECASAGVIFPQSVVNCGSHFLTDSQSGASPQLTTEIPDLSPPTPRLLTVMSVLILIARYVCWIGRTYYLYINIYYYLKA